MVWSRVLRFCLAFLLAAFVGGTIYVYNLKNVQVERMTTALRFARQTSLLVEQFFPQFQGPLSEKALDPKEALESAVRLVTRQTDPQWIEAAIIQDLSLTAGAERYQFDPKDWAFDYYKNMGSAGDFALKIRIHVGYLGLFGTKVPWLSDFLGVLIFVILLFTFFSLLGGTQEGFEDERDRDPHEHAQDVTPSPPGLGEAEVSELRTFLTTVARDVKDLTLASQRMIDSTGVTPQGEQMSKAIIRLMATMREMVKLLKKLDHVPVKPAQKSEDQDPQMGPKVA